MFGCGCLSRIKTDLFEQCRFYHHDSPPRGVFPVLSDFLEEHSHAQDQFIYTSENQEIHQKIKASKTLILIDDEISTGKTFQKPYIKNLVESGLDQVERIVLVSLVNWNDGNLEPEYLGIPMETVALINGSGNGNLITKK